MARYILIDQHSGYIFADTADLPNVVISTSEGLPMTQSTMSGPVDAVRWFDEAVSHEHGLTYDMTPTNCDNHTGFHVYRVDIDGSDVVPVVNNGQDQDEIDAVLAHCEYAGFVAPRLEGLF